MTKYQNKSALIRDMETEHSRLENILSKIAEQDMLIPGVIGVWSVKDILAHLSAWEWQFVEWYRDGIEGKESKIVPVGMSRKVIDEFNQRVFEKFRKVSLKKIAMEFKNSHAEILVIIPKISEEDMFQPGKYSWTGELLLADYIAGNTINHYYWARSKIREWLKTQNKL